VAQETSKIKARFTVETVFKDRGEPREGRVGGLVELLSSRLPRGDRRLLLLSLGCLVGCRLGTLLALLLANLLAGPPLVVIALLRHTHPP
jgi:hypothetical protein